MTDRDKVIKGLEKCKRHECDDCTEKGASQAPWDCPAYDDFVDSALALLKEQPEIVRCKDCKHRTTRVCNKIEFWECNHLRYGIAKCGVTDDWFCADGEMKCE